MISKLRRFCPGGSTRYIEPFAGSACLFFALEPREAILGDVNEELISTYRTVKTDAGRVLECLNRLSIGREAYYRIRAVPPASLAEAEKAARFIYLNKYCFNGLYRTNRAGQFNVPFGDTKGCDSINGDAIVSAAKLLQRALLVCGDFERTLVHASEGDFVYLDPPFSVGDRRIFTEYHPDSFCAPDLTRLVNVLHDLDSRGATFLLSYADSPEGRRVLRPWHPARVRAQRHISGFAANRRAAYELLATNVK